MAKKQTYEELEQRVKNFEKEVVDRKRIEEALRESELRQKALSEASFEAIFLSEKGVCLDQNKTAERMFGFTRAEAVGRHGTEWIVPEDREQVKNNMLSGYEKPYEVTALRKDDTTFPAEIQARMIHYGGRNIRVTALRDLTERKQSEEASRESEIKHKTLVNNIPGMVYRAYPDWSAEIISGSEAICDYTEKELNSKEENWLSIIHHDDKERVLKAGSELTQAQKDLVQIYRIKTKDGDIRWVEDRKTSIFSEKGKFIGIDGIVFNITDRKRTEEALRESEERFRLLSEASFEGIAVSEIGMILDAKKKIILPELGIYKKDLFCRCARLKPC